MKQPSRRALGRIASRSCSCAAYAHAAIALISGKVVSIADGDTLTIVDSDKKQHRIRLAEIDAPEHGQPWGNRAKEALADKVFGKEVDIEVVDADRYHRLVGRVHLEDGRDINREMVRQGHAWVYRRYLRHASLLDDEEAARDAKRELWSLPNPIPPWEWRHPN